MTHALSDPTRAATRPQPAGYRPDPLAEERAAAWRLLAEHQTLAGIAAAVRNRLGYVKPSPLSAPNLAEARDLARALELLLAGVEPALPRGLTDERPRYNLASADGWEG